MDKDPQRRPPAAELTTTLCSLARATAGVTALPPPAPGVSTDSVALRVSARPQPSHPTTPRASRRPPRPRNRPRPWRWLLPAVGIALVAAALVTGAVGGLPSWPVGDTGRPAVPAAPAEAQRRPAPAPAASGAPPVPAVPGPSAGAADAPTTGGQQPPDLAVDSHLPIARAARAGAKAQAMLFGPWQCADAYQWALGHPALAKPCYAVGGAIRVLGHMQATPGVQADVSLTVEDVETAHRSAGPYTCGGLMFTDFAPEHSCGPFDVDLPRGRRYVVVESWQYTGRGLLPGGTTRGPEFSW
jgi:serine/threonine-protein kinase